MRSPIICPEHEHPNKEILDSLTQDGGVTNWGSIGGSLSNQTDLSSALVGKTTLSEVKADTDIADAINKKHSNTLDHSNSFDHSNNLDHANTNDPSADQKAALAGTNGTPSATNKLVTNSDPRNSDARTPTTHSNHTISDVANLQTSLDSKEPANINIQTHVGSAHAPSNAQKNSDITKAEIEAKLTGEITSHSHAGGGGGTIVFLGDI